MTLEESIKYHEDIAEINELYCEEHYDEEQVSVSYRNANKYASECRQIAKWLKELKAYREKLEPQAENNREWDSKIDGLPNTIHYSDECLKFRHKDYVLYNVEWLKENYQQELELLGVEQPKEEDCISRQALLREIGEEPENWTDTDREIQAINDYRWFVKAIKSMPSVTPQQRWIPCSEKQPEEWEDVLCYSPLFGMVIGSYHKGKFETDMGWTDDVVAWMKLPEAFEEDKNDT